MVMAVYFSEKHEHRRELDYNSIDEFCDMQY